ncbi:hypothetical protein CCUS01_12653 [Colletotrichum cuscutae]|uniref:Uncharacterized protein n=1 Tax=Colletotrichum cuscutae TaxID=1209917 RepID=A0AAI9TVF6_9PEZI|nr:hypothetical protein CCUS01_12653 [Colletotrichum cuscutae]
MRLPPQLIISLLSPSHHPLHSNHFIQPPRLHPHLLLHPHTYPHLHPPLHPVSSSPPLPITTPRKQPSKPLQPNPINLVEPISLRTVHVNNRHQRVLDDDRHDDLAPAVPITRNVPRKGIDVGHELGLARGGGGAADAAAKGDLLAGDFAHEGAQDEGSFGGRG